MIENCLGTTRKAVVLRVEDNVLDFIDQEQTLEAMFLKPMGQEEGIFRESEVDRPDLFWDPFASGRSEDKLSHVVKGFMMMDQRLATPGNELEPVNGARKPVRRLARSAMKWAGGFGWVWISGSGQ
jgi:hypothetical protein